MIPLKVKGTPNNISHSFIGKIIKDTSDLDNYIVDNYVINKKIILSKKPSIFKNLEGIFNLNLDHLTLGDIVIVFPNGIVNTLFRIESKNNIFFMTNNCNQDCIMCSQPPKKAKDIKQFFNINYSLIDFIPLTTKQIGISGGEPTLCGKYLNLLLSRLFEKIPTINVFILTNGVLLSDIKYFQNFKGLPKEKILFSIPLYGDNYITHDSIVQSEGAFYKTIRGIYNLFKFGFRVELRVIPQKRNLLRLEKLSHFIYKNLIFVEDVTFMGLENTGKASKNIDIIWITPEELITQLRKATDFLIMSGMSCALYNYQNCILAEQLRPLSLSTISDWKREYLSECSYCQEKNNCGGIFSSSTNLLSKFIHPIKSNNK